MRRSLLVAFCVLAFPLMASHIVGGEFEIIHVNGSIYRVNLILYFDDINGSPGALDQNVMAAIYRKSDNKFMRTVSLPLTSTNPVSYMQPECSKGEIKTTKLTYTTTISMSAAEYGSEGGYYIVWERCCRNYTITNIYSNNPVTPGGIYAGQTFYLEFPPVVKDGAPFINSTPQLFPPLNDYACAFKPYYVDFAGTDADGDSLAYSIVTPLNTKTANALPLSGIPGPRDYPLVTYRPGFSGTNIVKGAPDLRISPQGFLTVTPTQAGLFVFAVRCEEFRNKIKIGEVRRDFQMLVLDNCGLAIAPKIKGKRITDNAFTFVDNMSISFSNTVSDADRCIQVEVSDMDASMAYDNFTEKVRIRAVAIGFNKNMSSILPDVTTATLSNGSTRTFDICFDQCPPFESGSFKVGIVAYDDACSQPLTDTLLINVVVQPPTNTKPYFTTPNVNTMLNEGETKVFPIEAKDDEANPLIVGIVTDGFVLDSAGMTVNVKTLENGLYQSEFIWETKCDVYNFRSKQDFNVKFLVEDKDLCNFQKLDTMVFQLKVKLPGNALPQISTSLSDDEVKNGITRKVFETLAFDVYGNDADDNIIDLSGAGVGFNLSNYKMTFPPVQTGEGLPGLSGRFEWKINCDNIDLKNKNFFELRFLVVDDNNKCRFYQADTLLVKVKVEPPDNKAPTLQVVNQNPSLAFADNFQSIFVGQQITLALTGTDLDTSPTPDQISIDLIDATGSATPVGYLFEPSSGLGATATTFTWNPECSIFSKGVWSNDYTFKFRVKDNRCFNPKEEIVEVDFLVRDVASVFSDFIPPNFVTPNGDGVNDFFGMYKYDGEIVDPENPEKIVSILPVDNCAGRFVSIRVYNRWGRDVFFSENREFKWYPSQDAVGVYFYTITFTDKEYKGSITVQR